jgi:hypothetical protein
MLVLNFAGKGFSTFLPSIKAGMDEKPLAAIPQRRTLPLFKGNFSIAFTLDNINRQYNISSHC